MTTRILKPCPFCGSEDVTTGLAAGTTLHFVRCDNCFARGPSVDHENYPSSADARGQALLIWCLQENPAIDEREAIVAHLRDVATEWEEVAVGAPNGAMFNHDATTLRNAAGAIEEGKHHE